MIGENIKKDILIVVLFVGLSILVGIVIYYADVIDKFVF